MPKTRKSGEGNIRKRADGRWEVRITIGIDYATGEPKRISKYTQTEEEAVHLLHEMSYLRDTTPYNFKNMKLGEWLDLCLNVYMKNSLKQSTYNSYESYIRVHLKPTLGDLQLRDLTPRILQQYYNYKTETEGLAPKTVININLFLHRALSFAVSEGYITANPAEAINLSRGVKPQIDILTRDEQNILIRTSYGHRYGVFVRLVLFTGLRLGELLGLRWEDVDFTAGLLHIRRTLNRLNKVNRAPGECSTEIVMQTPKSQNSIRSIPLLGGILKELDDWRKVQAADRFIAGEEYIDSGMIVTNTKGGYVEPRTFKDYYEQILAQSGLRHFTFHALRHTFASRAMEQGMDPKTLSVILGHYSVAFTLDTYSHVLTDHKVKEMGLMEELFQTPMDNTPQTYTIIITPQDDGMLYFTTPDFPAVSFVSLDLQGGVQYMRERIQEEILTGYTVPGSTGEGIVLEDNQMLVQIAVHQPNG